MVCVTDCVALRLSWPTGDPEQCLKVVHELERLIGPCGATWNMVIDYNHQAVIYINDHNRALMVAMKYTDSVQWIKRAPEYDH